MGSAVLFITVRRCRLALIGFSCLYLSSGGSEIETERWKDLEHLAADRHSLLDSTARKVWLKSRSLLTTIILSDDALGVYYNAIAEWMSAKA